MGYYEIRQNELTGFFNVTRSVHAIGATGPNNLGSKKNWGKILYSCFSR